MKPLKTFNKPSLCSQNIRSEIFGEDSLKGFTLDESQVVGLYDT